MWLFVMWCAILAVAVYLYYRQKYSYYEKRGVKTEKVTPFLGHMGGVLLRREHFVDSILRLYRTFPDERFVGRYEMTKPVLVIHDLELIKKITVKDFEHFLDHRQVFPKEVDPIFGRVLVTMQGHEWRDMRSALSPAFTSSKIRLMVPFMVDVGDSMIAVIKQKIKDNGGYLDEDMKDLTTRYANDVIASCAFGLKVDSHGDRGNEFYRQGLVATTFKFKQLIVFLTLSAFPWVMKKLNITLFPKETSTFFSKLVLDTMKDREARKIFRPDMIHLLMQAKKGQLTHEDKTDSTDAGFATVEESSVGKKTNNRVWSDIDLIAQALIFFFAGFETISSAMIFLLYELAVNPDVQNKLVQEIKEANANNGGKFDFNSIQKMTYMDMVVSESLRMWPAAIALDRQCVKDYNLGKPNDKAKNDYIMRKGEGLQIPVWAFHHDPKYFPNPKKFDPERFSDENKQKIHPFSYAPFGLGPRNCIGSRFALCEIKVMIYQLLLNLEVVPGPKTCIPAELDKTDFKLIMKGGHWLRFKIRN